MARLRAPELACLPCLFFSLLLSSATAFSAYHFDPREATVKSIHDALFSQSITCREVVSSYIGRIEAFDPSINAIISLNPDALAVADQLDLALTRGNATGPLFCTPVLLKDNFDAVGMVTTGGCLALADNRPSVDAPTVRALKDSGAVILGKTNLHEMALEGLSVSSLAGQTVNPYDHTRTPGGSSGGTGAAVAAALAVFGTGTDTVNSLRSPAASNSLFSFRPTRGLIPTAGVIPVSCTQDTVGAIARNLDDLAIALSVMASVGPDREDAASETHSPGTQPVDYRAALRGGSLRGVRLGLLDGFLNRTASEETTPVNDIMAASIAKLASAGAEIVNITDPVYNATAILALDVQAYEYRELLDAYLSNRRGLASFAELYGSGKFLVIPAQYPFIRRASALSTSDENYATAQEAIKTLTSTLHTTFATHNLDAIFYPQQKNLVVKIGSPSQTGRNGILAALTGSPVMVVPGGFSPRSEEAPVGVPVGIELLGLPRSEARLLNIAMHLNEALEVPRRMPVFANGSIEAREYAAVPSIRLDGQNIGSSYPIGVF